MRPSRKMQRHIVAFGAAILLVFVVLIANILRILVVKGDELEQRALSQQLRETTISAARGDITDSSGVVLATSNTVWNIYVSPADIKSDEQREGIAKGLSEILGLDYNETLEKCKGDNYYSVIAKKIEKTTVDKVLEFASDNDYKAIHTEETTKRYYPYNELAASVLGFVGTDNQGLNGIESYFDSYLSGTDGKSVSLVNAKSGGIEYDYERLYEAEDGATIELTIDYNIQSFVEKYLQEAVEEHNAAKRGACIAIDVKTGDVLAMATAPGFNCNDPFTIYDDDAQARIDATVDDLATEEDEKAEAKTAEQILQWKNKAITELYEPGSVFKILTAAACLEEGTSSMADTFFCSGYSVVSGVTIKCSSYSKGGHGAEDFTDIMKYSCNVGFMEIASKLGAFQFTRYYNAFGLTEKTGIELPGEESSIYVSYEDMGTVELASSSFGQTNKMSMIELGMAVAACVNGGYLYKPQIVSRIIDANGNVIVNNQPELVRQVISNSTSQKICEILEHVVADSDGTGKNAYVNGYRIGGKSGTAQKLDSTDTSAYVASFLAVAPIDDPQILVYMILDEAHSYSVYGSNLVAPYVGKIMADALPYLGVEPSYADDAQVSVSWVTGKTTIDAETALVKKGLKLNIIGNGTSVVSQFPTGGTSVSAGSTITLYTEEGGDKQMTTVPNLVGVTASTVNKIATNSQLNITIIGTSTSDTVTKSVSQSIPAGESVEVGTVIEVQFQSTIVDE